MRRSIAREEAFRAQQDGLPTEDIPEPPAEIDHPERPAAGQATLIGAGNGVRILRPCICQARRYLDLLADGDAPHSFQPYFDLGPSDQKNGWLCRTIYGPLGDVWPELVARQSKGAAIAVTMAETEGRGRKSADMIRPRAVWIEADGPLPRTLPIPPTITVQTSPGHGHYVYMARDLTWDVWHGIQQALIADYGSDRRAALRTHVLRVPGTLHLKDPAHPHLVQIVEDLTSEHIYAAAEIAAAFPPRPSTSRSRHRDAAARILRAGHCVEPGADWNPASVLAAHRSIDARLQQSGPFVAQGDRPGDKPIQLDWSRRDCWKEIAACLQSGMPPPGDGVAACRSPGLSGPRGRKLRPSPPGGIPGIRECAMTTIVPCLSLRHGFCSVWCRGRRASRLSSASTRTGSGTDTRAGHRVGLLGQGRNHSWFDANHSSGPSSMVEDLVVLNPAASLLEIDGRA
jgi:RepB DNA-primase from phage plasmid